MSSKRRLQSSRANGAKSRGPTTPEGKLISSQNSTIHSFAAKTLVLTNESRDRFQTLLQSYQHELQPHTQIESDLIEQMAVSKWRRRRLWTVESATLDLVMERQGEAISKEFASVDEPTRIAIAFQSTAENGTMGPFHRYETSMRRSWDRALDRLEAMRTTQQSRAREQAEADLPNEPSPTDEH
jgi:hypothetical protein